MERLIHNYSYEKNEVEKAAILAYLRLKEIDLRGSKRLEVFLGETNAHLVNSLVSYLEAERTELSLYWLVDVFEQLADAREKKEKGIVYTPVEIQRFIISNLFLDEGSIIPRVCDPSCGCGSFLLTATVWIHEKFGISYHKVLSHYIYGIEIEEHAVKQAELLFDILLMEHDEIPAEEYHIVWGDATDKRLLDSIKMEFGDFDYVIGNPPYVRSRNMSQIVKSGLYQWKSASVGNVDLYIPFYEIGLYLLGDNGGLGYISPNTFMQAVNGRGLRQLLVESESQVRIADFRQSQIFGGVTSYTCIVWINKEIKNKSILYARIKGADTIVNPEYVKYSGVEFAPDKSWRMYDSGIRDIVWKLEHSGKRLDSWKIRNGLATLKNELYFFIPSTEDTDFYFREYRGNTYRIEKNICIDVAKPNIIKNEAELALKGEKAIFPYVLKEEAFLCYSEEEMQNMFPYAYDFLREYKEELANRDKGKGKYPAWYAYGRTQGMNNMGKKLLIPYIGCEPIAVMCSNPKMLFYCGYALISENEEELKILKKFLESDAFWYYICSTSKPYSKGYMAFAKNYIARFTIPSLTHKEAEWLLNVQDKAEMNAWIWKKYGVEDAEL